MKKKNVPTSCIFAGMEHIKEKNNSLSSNYIYKFSAEDGKKFEGKLYKNSTQTCYMLESGGGNTFKYAFLLLGYILDEEPLRSNDEGVPIIWIR